MSAPPAGISEALNAEFLRQYPYEVAELVESGPRDTARELFETSADAIAVGIFSRMNAEGAAQLVPALSEAVLGRIIPKQDPEFLVKVVARLEESERARILAVLPEGGKRELQELLTYPSDRAGAFMDAKPMLFSPETTVEQALRRVRGAKRKRITDLIIVDEQGKLEAKIPLQAVAVADWEQTLIELKDKEPLSVQAMASKEVVVELMERHRFASLPVVDAEGRVAGVIRYDALMSIFQQDAQSDLTAMVGVSPDEKALSGAFFAIRKRLPWLTVNLLTTFLAAAVVGIFEGTIAKLTALAVLLPVVAGQSGNTGAQALAVTMRGLALREVRIRHWWKILRKETQVGAINGLCIGTLCGLSVYFWDGSAWLGLIIAAAMVIAMMAAGAAGVLIPVLLTAFRQDPAQSSSIILTTITDVVGFLSFLGLATVFSRALGV